MTNPVFASVPAGFDTDGGFLVTSMGATAVVIMDTLAAAAESSTSPLYYGGGTLIDGSVSSTDTVSRDVVLWKGKVYTTQDATATGVMSSTVSTIVRTAGNFITDGLRVGETVMIFASPVQAVNVTDGILAVITAVAALTLTVSGAPLVACTFSAGTRVTRVKRLFTTTIPANSGNTNAIPNVQLLNNSMDKAVSLGDRKLGKADLLAMSSTAAVTAASVIAANVQYARY